jgi:hypothetical protein
VCRAYQGARNLTKAFLPLSLTSAAKVALVNSVAEAPEARAKRAVMRSDIMLRWEVRAES